MFFHIKTDPGYYFAVIAVGNLFGPLILGRLFDSLGRKPMIAGAYILSGVLLLLTAWLFNAGDLSATTAAGGITGPLLFSTLVSTGKVIDTVIAFVIGATLMILAGLVEVFLGVKAERKGLEEIASPLTAEDADRSVGARAG